MGKSFIPLSVPNLQGNELKYVTDAINDEWVSTGGAFIELFEKATSKYVKAVGAVACQSGTAGIHLALLLKGIGQDDEVIAPALTFVAAVNPIKYVGANPVFMDCDDSLCIDMEKVEKFCRDECNARNGNLINKHTGKCVRAMIVVHVFGNIADMGKAVEIANKYNLVLIEDATEALGSYITKGKYAGKFAGTIGDVGIFSYNGNKIITTGGGGMIVSNDKGLLEKAKYLSTQAKDDSLYYVHNEVGYNYRMTNLQAALGLAQLEQLEKFIEIKKRNYDLYNKLGISLLPFKKNARANYWFYSFLSDNRDGLINDLQEKGIQTRPIWNLICDLRPYQKDYHYEIEKCRNYWNHVINLPCSTNLSEENVESVVRAIHSVE